MRAHRHVTALLVLALCACATPPAPPVQRSGTTVGASLGRSWDAAITEFADNNIPIQTIERASGLIVSQMLSVTPAVARGKADCGTNVGEPILATSVTYNVLVRGDSSTTVVKVSPRWIAARGTASVECSSTGTWETELEQRIRVLAEKKR